MRMPTGTNHKEENDMLREGMTIREAAEMWVREFNAIPQGMIEKLMGLEPDNWHEVTAPAAGRRVYVFNLPDGCESQANFGEIVGYNEDEDTYTVEMDDGAVIVAEESNFEVETDDSLPMWGTMWSFGDSCDDHWMEDQGGVRIMSECGFRVFESDDFGYFFGIDGAGYSFYEAHWEPLYRARGLQWHDPKAEEERQMRNKGYHKGKLGSKECWMDSENKVIKEVG